MSFTTGKIADASVTDSPRRPRGWKEYEVVEDRHEDEVSGTANARFVEKPHPGVDTEARWVKKASKCRFGYKRHSMERERAVNKAVCKVRLQWKGHIARCTGGSGAALQGMWGLPRHTHSTSWRLSPTTCTERLGLLCPIASNKGEYEVREALHNRIFHGLMPFKALV